MRSRCLSAHRERGGRCGGCAGAVGAGYCSGWSPWSPRRSASSRMRPGVFHRTELQTIDARYQLRGSDPLAAEGLRRGRHRFVDVEVLRQFEAVKHHYTANWPFPRRDDARVIDNLVRAGAKHIAMDLQFTQPTDNTDDEDLLRAIAHAGHMVLATTSVGPHGSTEVMGGNANLWSLGGHSVPANASEIIDGDGVFRRMQYSRPGARTFGTAIAAHALGRPVSPKLFGGATTPVPIDYAGPPGTVALHLLLAGLRRRCSRLPGARQDGDHRRDRLDPAGSAPDATTRHRWRERRSSPTRPRPCSTASRCATAPAGSTCC